MNKPYIIACPPSDQPSAGIRVLKNLASDLRARGYEARTAWDGEAPPDTIVVYPEIVPGNPMKGSSVVRFVLYFPGAIGGDKTYDKGELIFTYAPIYYPGVPILTVPCIEPFFRDEGKPREGGCFWVGKGSELPRIPETEGLVEITHAWPASREDLAALLNTKDIFYTYDSYTALIPEAQKCGCKTVVIHGDGLSDYDESIKNYESQLDEFIRITQAKDVHRTTRKMKVSNQYLAIGVPLSFPMVPSSFFHSFVHMEKPDFIYIHTENGHMDDLRNNIVEEALRAGVSHLIMMDTDQVYHPLTIPTLLSRKLPVVGALVHRRYVPFDSLMLKLVEIDEHTNGYVSIDDWEPDSLVEVDAMGGGCTMFDMEVFRKLPYPWYRNDKPVPAGSQPIGEDIGFCQDLKEAGYRLFVDTSVPAGHLTTMIVNTATSKLYRACKSAQAAKEALRIDHAE